MDTQLQQHLVYANFLEANEKPKITCKLLKEFLKGTLEQYGRKQLHSAGVYLSGKKNNLLKPFVV